MPCQGSHTPLRQYLCKLDRHSKLATLFDEVPYDFEETSQLIKASQAISLDAHRMQSFSNNVEDLISSTVDCVCADPKDKIYSLLELLGSNKSKEIPVNCSKALFEVFADIMRFYFRLPSPPSLYTVRLHNSPKEYRL